MVSGVRRPRNTQAAVSFRRVLGRAMFRTNPFVLWPAKAPRPVVPEAAPAKASLESPKDLAGKAHRLLKMYCYRCHGENGAAEGGFNYHPGMKDAH